ncbi:MAG: hypothetical protein EOO36_20835 [Cytophagaceae bacterium]|nr:MAG: hypothetical protein EOO36_20835 [Cytophagaceae bacterium]
MATEPNNSNPLSERKGPLPNYQQNQADNAHLNPNEPATQAAAGTPGYGDFGKPENANPSDSAPANNDGSNDNPDEFSEFRDPEDAKDYDNTTDSPNANPEQQRGHVVQNRDPQGIRNVQNADRDVQEGTWADDDERYAGGHRKASWEENNDDEHSND